MMFKNPCEVTCKTCMATSMQRVVELLSLRAICPNCGTSFAEAGLRMRSASDSFSIWMDTIEIAMNLEKKLGGTIIDAEIERIRTLRDIAQLVENRLPTSVDREALSVGLALDAARELPDCPVELDLDVPLLDALYPSRWDKYSIWAANQVREGIPETGR